MILARDVLDNMRNMALQMKAYSEGLRGSVRVGDTPEKGRHRQWRPTPVVSSADALIEGHQDVGCQARREYHTVHEAADAAGHRLH